MLEEKDRYALIKTLADGSPFWVSGADSLTQGKLKLKELAATDEAIEYYLYDLQEHRKLVSSREALGGAPEKTVLSTEGRKSF